MKCVNKVILLGTVGKDPDVRYSKSGTAVANFSLATNIKKKQSDGTYQEKTTWHNCVAIGKLGEIVAQYLTKGTKTYIEGEIDISEYESGGETKRSFKIVVSELSMLSSKEESQGMTREKAMQSINEAIHDPDDPLAHIPF